VSAGAYVSTLTLITGLPRWSSRSSRRNIRLIAGLVGCYRGLTVSAAQGVGTAVNETLVLCVIACSRHVVLTTIGVRFGTGS